MAHPTPDAKRGFTLVELLVVIAIVALLVSILLPALSKAKEMGRFTLCASNQRQIGLALHAWSHDHDGRIVPGDLNNGLTIQLHYEPGNLGHLLDRDYLPLPTQDHNVIYCPSKAKDQAAEKLTYFHENSPYDFYHHWDKTPAEGGQGWVVITYLFRDSLDGGRNDFSLQKEPDAKGALIEKYTNNLIMKDTPHTGFAFHDNRFNFLFGDTSAQSADITEGTRAGWMLNEMNGNRGAVTERESFAWFDDYFGAPRLIPVDEIPRILDEY